jgi:hypothetical protein
MEKKRRLKEDIAEDITKLLEKRRILLEMKDHQRAHGDVAARISDDLEVAHECKRKIHILWTDVQDAATLLCSLCHLSFFNLFVLNRFHFVTPACVISNKRLCILFL